MELSTGHLLARVVAFCHRTLLSSSPARARAQQAGIASPALLERFRVGFSDGSLHSVAPPKGEILEKLKLIGILDSAGRERFAGSLIFPAFDDRDEPVQLAAYDENLKRTWLFDETPTWWNAGCLGHARHVLVASDPLAGARLVQAGTSGVIAPAGPGVPLGQAAKDLLLLHQPRLQLQGGDPKWKRDLLEELRQLGLSVLADEQPSPGSETILQQDANGLSVEFPRSLRFEVQGIAQDTARHLRASIKALRTRGEPRLHMDTLDLYHAKSRLAFARTAACLLDQDPDLMHEYLLRLVQLAESWLKERDKPAPAVVLTAAEEESALNLLQDPRLLDRLLADLGELGYVGEESNKLIAHVASISRKMQDPLSVLVMSRSGAGKSTLADMTALLAPPEDVLRLTRLTPQTLYYQKPNSLVHKLVLVEEEAGLSEAAYAVRALQSAGRLSLSSASGYGAAPTREVKGPCSIFVTTTRTDPDEETAGRFLILSSDESQEQTRRILEAQRLAESRPAENRQRILRVHQNAQRLIRPLSVVNPYAAQLKFPHERLSARRDHKKYLALIRAVALLHQRQRKIEKDSVLVEIRDIQIANRLADEALGKSLEDLSSPSKRLLLEIRQWNPKEPFSQRELRGRVGWKKTQLAAHVKELVEAEYLIAARLPGFGQRTRYTLDWDGRGLDGEKFFQGLLDTTQLSSSGTSGSRPAGVRSSSARAGSRPSGQRPSTGGESGPDVRNSGEKIG
jgi:energy-coupling factor transporter ATP-binding protein EcfA2